MLGSHLIRLLRILLGKARRQQPRIVCDRVVVSPCCRSKMPACLPIKLLAAEVDMGVALAATLRVGEAMAFFPRFLASILWPIPVSEHGQSAAHTIRCE